MSANVPLSYGDMLPFLSDSANPSVKFDLVTGYIKSCYAGPVADLIANLSKLFVLSTATGQRVFSNAEIVLGKIKVVDMLACLSKLFPTTNKITDRFALAEEVMKFVYSGSEVQPFGTAFAVTGTAGKGQWYTTKTTTASIGTVSASLSDAHYFSLDNGVHLTSITYQQLRTLTVESSAVSSVSDLYLMAILQLKYFTGTLGSGAALTNFDDLTNGTTLATNTTLLGHQLDVLNSMNAFASTSFDVSSFLIQSAPVQVPLGTNLNPVVISKELALLFWLSITVNSGSTETSYVFSKKYNLIKKTYFIDNKLSVDDVVHLGMPFNQLKTAGYTVTDVASSVAIRQTKNLNVARAAFAPNVVTYVGSLAAVGGAAAVPYNTCGIVCVDMSDAGAVLNDTNNLLENRLLPPVDNTAATTTTTTLSTTVTSVSVGYGGPGQGTGTGQLIAPADGVFYCSYTTDELNTWRLTSKDLNVITNYGNDFSSVHFATPGLVPFLVKCIDDGSLQTSSSLITGVFGTITAGTTLAAISGTAGLKLAVDDYNTVNSTINATHTSYNNTGTSKGWVISNNATSTSNTLTAEQILQLKYSAVLHWILSTRNSVIKNKDTTAVNIVNVLKDMMQIGDLKLENKLLIPLFFPKSTYLHKSTNLTLAEQVSYFSISIKDAFVKQTGTVTAKNDTILYLRAQNITVFDHTHVNYSFYEVLQQFPLAELVKEFDPTSLMLGAYVYSDTPSLTLFQSWYNSTTNPDLLPDLLIANRGIKWNELIKAGVKIEDLVIAYSIYKAAWTGELPATENFAAQTANPANARKNLYAGIASQYPDLDIPSIYKIIGKNLPVLLLSGIPVEKLQQSSVADLSSLPKALDALDNDPNAQYVMEHLKQILLKLNYPLEQYRESNLYSLNFMLKYSVTTGIYNTNNGLEPSIVVARYFSDVEDRLNIINLYYPKPAVHSADVKAAIVKLANASNDNDVDRKISLLNVKVAAENATGATGATDPKF